MCECVHLQECWLLRKGSVGDSDEVEYEEELYAAGNMVIWSQGSRGQASHVYKAFTVDSPVQQVTHHRDIKSRILNQSDMS